MNILKKMPKSCSQNKNIYDEAISHCRWKSVLRSKVLNNIILQQRNLYKFSDKSFEQILLIVNDICKEIKGIGMLTIYDITAAICRYNKINIDKVYIIAKVLNVL